MNFLIVGYSRPNKILSILPIIMKNLHEGEKIIISIDDYYKNPIWLRIEERFHNHKIEWIKHSERLGLEKHVISACDLASKFGDFIFIEEDIQIADISIEFLRIINPLIDEKLKIRQISLSSIEWNELDGIPFIENLNGCNIFLSKVSTSWGVFYRKSWWEEFYDFYKNRNEIFPHNSLAKWKNSWKKYHFAFLNARGYYTLYPSEHLAIHQGKNGTNTSDHVRNFYRAISNDFMLETLEINLRHEEKIPRFDVNLQNEKLSWHRNSLHYFLRSVNLKDILTHLLKRYVR